MTEERSVLQPEVTLVTRAANVVLLQVPSGQTPCNQESRGEIIEELDDCKKRPVRPEASIHCASGEAAMDNNVDWHWEEMLTTEEA